MQTAASQAGDDPGLARNGQSIWCSVRLPVARVRARAKGLFPPSGTDRHVGLFALTIVLHIGIWWIVALVLYAPADIHNDMAEAFAWGRDLQWGYYKHPPFWALITKLWFLIFPTADWAFYLLAVVNSAVGLVGVWAIAGRYVSGTRRLAAVLLLELVPFNNVLAFTFNANSMQSSLWPWTLYVFIVSFESRRSTAAVGFGLLAAAAIMSKYFGGVLLVSCLIAAVTSPRVGEYFRSAAPYVTIAVFGACVAPHIIWLTRVSNGPLDYLATKTAYPFPFVLEKAATFVAGIFLLHSFLEIVLLLFWLRRGKPGWELAPIQPAVLVTRPRVRLVLVLAVAPFLVAVLVSLVGNVRLSTKFALPLCSLIPLIWIIFHGARLSRPAMFAVVMSVGLFMASSLILAIPTAILKFKSDHRHFADPRAIVARQVTDLWHAYAGKPLRIVSGTEGYALAATFYSADHPSDFIDLSRSKAPWIDDARLGREGLAIICSSYDRECLDNMKRLEPLDSTRVNLTDISKTFLWYHGERSSFVVLLVRPGQAVDSRALTDGCKSPAGIGAQ